MGCKHLQLNDSKTEIMVFSKCVKPSVEGLDMHIEPSSVMRGLGVILDNQLSFEAHIKNRCKLAFWQLRDIRRTARFCSRETLVLLVHRYVFPQIYFCMSLTAGLPQNLHNKVQRVINAAARLVTGCHYTDHISPHLRELKWLTSKKSAQLALLTIVSQCLTTGQPEYLKELITVHRPTRELRSDDLFNNLPFYYRKIAFSNTQRFKHELKAFFLNG